MYADYVREEERSKIVENYRDRNGELQYSRCMKYLLPPYFSWLPHMNNKNIE